MTDGRAQEPAGSGQAQEDAETIGLLVMVIADDTVPDKKRLQAGHALGTLVGKLAARLSAVEGERDTLKALLRQWEDSTGVFAPKKNAELLARTRAALASAEDEG